MSKEKLIPNLNTFSDLVDRLSVEINKISFWENRKREEQSKDKPNAELIMAWDQSSREACELRSALKNKINKLLSEIVETRSYQTYKEPRTFRPAKSTIADILDEMCENNANTSLKRKLAKALEKEL